MRRLAIFVFAWLLLGAAPALAATPDEVVDDVADTGVFVEPGLSVDRDSIDASVVRARNGGLRFSVVLLDENPAGGAVAFADAVLDRIGSGTVLVLSETGEGMASDEVDRSTIEAALDRGFEAGGGDAGYVDTVVASLLGESGSPDGDDSGGGVVFLLVIVVVVVVGLWWFFRRQRGRDDARRRRAVEEARTEIRSQLDAMANTILEIADQVAATESQEDNEYFGLASKTYAEASEAFPEASDLRSLERLSDRLDEARWQLDAAVALLEGKAVPPKPKQEERHACFFDPTHPDATETAEIETAAGNRTVRVCKADAAKLRRGEQPKPRMIDVDGRRVPAPQAPRSHGGGGFDWLDVFSVILGGIGQGASYDWGRGGSSSRRSGGSRGSRWGSSSSGRTRSRAGRTRQRAGRTRSRRR